MRFQPDKASFHSERKCIAGIKSRTALLGEQRIENYRSCIRENSAGSRFLRIQLELNSHESSY